MTKTILSISYILLLFFCLNNQFFAQEEDYDSKKNPKRGGTLIFARSGDAVGLDPARETDGESYYVADNVYETLVTYKPGTTEIIPCLAQRWEISENGLEYTFHLRKSVRFHDRTDFNADAVLFSLNRQLKKDHPYNRYGPWLYWSAMAMNKIIKDIQKIDDYTVLIILKKREAALIANLAMHFASIVSPTTAEKEKQNFKFVVAGTGPFKLTKWVRKDQIVLERFDDYWGEKAYLDRLILKVIRKPTERYLALKKGEVDIIDFPSRDDISNIEKDPLLKIVKSSGMNVGYMALNMKKAPLDNKLVRQAINHAINKKEIVKAIYGVMGRPAKNPIPPNIWSYNDDIQDYDYNPEKARSLLAQAGYEDGFELTLWAMPVNRPYNPNARKMAELMQKQLQEVGIRIKIVSYEWGTYLNKIDKLEHDMCLIGWTGDNGDPDNFLYVLLSEDATRLPALNYAYWKNAVFNELIIKAKESSDFEERVKLYRKAQEIFKEEAPWVPIAHSIVMVPMKKSVMGFKPYPTGNKKFHSVWLDKTSTESDSNYIETISIGINAPLTGDSTKVGQETKLAAQIWAEELNQNGGILLGDKKYKVKLIIKDNQLHPELAVDVNKTLINNDNVLAIVGPQFSTQAIPAGELANRYKTPMISPWSTNPKTTQNRPYVFRTCFIDESEAHAMVNFIDRQWPFRKAAILFNEDKPYSKNMAAFFYEKWLNKDKSVVAYENFQQGDKDLLPQLTKIVQSDADFLYLPLYYLKVNSIVKRIREMGWTKPIIGTESWDSLQTDTPYNKDCTGIFLSTHYTSNGVQGMNRLFIDKYKKKANAVPWQSAALTWDSLNLLKTALMNMSELSGDISRDRQILRYALAEVKNFNGITGRISKFDQHGNPQKCVVIVRIDSQGQFQFHRYACHDDPSDGNNKKHLIIASDATWPPMEFINEQKQTVGFEMDLMRAIAKEAGFTYEIRNTAWSDIFAGLAVDKFDAVLSAVTITDDRRKRYDFSDPYINAGQVLIVRSDIKRIKKLSYLKGKTIGARINSPGSKIIERLNWLKLKKYENIDSAIKDLIKGRIAAYITHLPLASDYVYHKARYRRKLRIAG